MRRTTTTVAVALALGGAPPSGEGEAARRAQSVVATPPIDVHQPGASPNPKDKLEGALRDLVCARKFPLRDAQHLIATDWAAAYRQILGTDPPR